MSMLGEGCDFAPYVTILLVLLSPFVFGNDSLVKYHGKFMVYYLSCSFAAIFMIPIFLFDPKNVRNSRFAASVVKYNAQLLGVDFELRNKEILEEDRGAIIVSNHQSTLDVLGMFNIWDVMDKCAAVAKKEIFYVWPFGLAAWLAGVVFIDRSSPEKSYQTLEETAKLTGKQKVHRLKNFNYELIMIAVIEWYHTKIWLYPEGTRNKYVNKTRKLLPFRRGAFKMAISCQVPIIPVVYSPYYFINPKKNFFGKGKIVIQPLPPIPTEGLTENDVEDIMKKTRDVLQEAYEILFKEIEANVPPNYPGLV